MEKVEKAAKALFALLFVILTVSGALAFAPPKPAPVAESKATATAKAEVKSETAAKAEHVELEPTTPAIALPAVSPQSVSFVTEKKNKPEIKTVDNYVAIFDFEVRDKDKDISRPLADRVIHVFSQSDKYEVIDRGNMNKILGEQKFQMSGCVAQECKVEAGQILGVGKIVSGSVGLVGKTYYLTLQLIDVKTGKVELSAEDECKCEIDELLGSTRRLAKKLLGEKVEQPVATVPSHEPSALMHIEQNVAKDELTKSPRVSPDFRHVKEVIMPAIVNVRVTINSESENILEASGFIISTDGYIFTNNHIVDKAWTITIKIANGKEFNAKIIGRDKYTNLALLKIKVNESLYVAPFGDSDKLRVGDWVLALGTSLRSSSTLSPGMITNKSSRELIQTDAPINSKDIGGPLINIEGKVIGINNTIGNQEMSKSTAIPISIAKDILSDLKVKGYVSR